MIAKHSSNYNKKPDHVKQQLVEHHKTNKILEVDEFLFNFLHTEAILEDSEQDLKACERGVIDSSNISRALSPGPTVKASKPTKRNYRLEYQSFVVSSVCVCMKICKSIQD